MVNIFSSIYDIFTPYFTFLHNQFMELSNSQSVFCSLLFIHPKLSGCKASDAFNMFIYSSIFNTHPFLFSFVTYSNVLYTYIPYRGTL